MPAVLHRSAAGGLQPEGSRQQLIQPHVMSQDLAAVPTDDVDRLATRRGLLKLEVDAPRMGPDLHCEDMEGGQAPLDPLALGKGASVVAHRLVPSLALGDDADR